MARLNRTRISLALLALLCGSLGAAQADDSISTAYATILQGDYDGGQKTVARLRAHDQSDPRVLQVDGWLDGYKKIVDARQQLREKSFEWNVEHAKQALAGDRLYLALSFAAQAVPYAPDETAYTEEPWIVDLTQKGLEEAQKISAEKGWTKALNYYWALERLHSEDEKIKDLREAAVRRARFEVIYKDKEALDRRIKGVNDWSLLRAAAGKINDNYYQAPNFKKMVEGALANLLCLAETKRLQEVCNGLADPLAREIFVKKLLEEQKDLEDRDTLTHKDFQRIYRRIEVYNKETVELPEGLLVVEYLEGALQKLDDFTSMVWPADAVEFDKLMLGDFEGVGIQLGTDEATGRLKVVTPLENSPALEAGIRPDDLIIEVNGESTKGWTTDDAVRNIMGEAGTEVVLTMFRPSLGERIPYQLKRRQIVLRTVRGVERLKDGSGEEWNHILDSEQGIAYIRLTGFHPDSQKELLDALNRAQKQGMRALILDLRHNPGGLLDVAVNIVGTFLGGGKEVVSTDGRRDPRQSLEVRDTAPAGDLPLIVLANEHSASASEIVAGALQDHGRAMVLGERTFGKGSVQRVLPLAADARLKLTTALYYLPSKRSPHKSPGAKTWGVDPDWEIKLTPKEVRKILERSRDVDIIRNTAADAVAKESPDDPDRKAALEALKIDEKSDEDDEEVALLSEEDIKVLQADPNDAPAVDPLLETALLQMRVKLAGGLPWPRLAAAKAAEASDKK